MLWFRLDLDESDAKEKGEGVYCFWKEVSIVQIAWTSYSKCSRGNEHRRSLDGSLPPRAVLRLMRVGGHSAQMSRVSSPALPERVDTEQVKALFPFFVPFVRGLVGNFTSAPLCHFFSTTTHRLLTDHQLSRNNTITTLLPNDDRDQASQELYIVQQDCRPY